MSCPDPFASFIEELVIDLKDPQVYVSDILCKLSAANTVYQNNKSTTSLSQIANDFFNCIEPKLTADAVIFEDSIGFTAIILVIITAIFIFISIMVFAILRNNSTELILGFIFFILVIYVVIAAIILFSASKNISTVIINLRADLSLCINNTANEIANFESTQENAVNNALCTYLQPCTV